MHSKSAPRIGYWMSVMMKMQQNVLWKPKLRASDQLL